MTIIDILYIIFFITIIIYALFNKGEIKKKEDTHPNFKQNEHR